MLLTAAGHWDVSRIQIYSWGLPSISVSIAFTEDDLPCLNFNVCTAESIVRYRCMCCVKLDSSLCTHPPPLLSPPPPPQPYASGSLPDFCCIVPGIPPVQWPLSHINQLTVLTCSVSKHNQTPMLSSKAP